MVPVHHVFFFGDPHWWPQLFFGDPKGLIGDPQNRVFGDPKVLIGDPPKLKNSKNQISIKFFSDYDWVSKTSLRCVFSISNIRLSIWYMYNRFFLFFSKMWSRPIFAARFMWSKTVSIQIEDCVESKNKCWDLEELIKSVLFHIRVIEIWWIFKEIEAREKNWIFLFVGKFTTVSHKSLYIRFCECQVLCLKNNFIRVWF